MEVAGVVPKVVARPRGRQWTVGGPRWACLACNSGGDKMGEGPQRLWIPPGAWAEELWGSHPSPFFQQALGTTGQDDGHQQLDSRAAGRPAGGHTARRSGSLAAAMGCRPADRQGGGLSPLPRASLTYHPELPGLYCPTPRSPPEMVTLPGSSEAAGLASSRRAGRGKVALIQARKQDCRTQSEGRDLRAEGW